MAPEASKLARRSRDIPRDIIYDAIFPRLPYKSAMRLKCVSLNDKKHIASYSFATKQSKLCPACPAIIYMGHPKKDSNEYRINILSSTPSTVGIPSSRLDFLLDYSTDKHFYLLSSSNGLLCICCKSYNAGPLTSAPTFLIVNPATHQALPIPGSAQHISWKLNAVGLVFDPCDQPTTDTHKFQIINAFPVTATKETFLQFRFIIFSSDTGRWVMSETTLDATINKRSICDKAVYASGVVFWHYVDVILWFDATTNEARVLKLPTKKLQESRSEEWEWQSMYGELERRSIDVSNTGKLMCTLVNKDGLAMYELKIKADHWELKHEKGWKDIVDMNSDAFQFCHSMKLRNAWQMKFCEKWLVRPLGLENGRYVYLGVREKYKTPDRVLRYDMETSKVEDIGKKLGNPFEMNSAFGYRNSMAPVPPIKVPNPEDGLCNGKAGGCICVPEESEA